MADSSNDASSGSSQQIEDADTEPVDASTSNVEDTTAAAEDQEITDFKDAILQHKLNRIDEIFENDPSLVNSPWIPPNRETPLHYACRWRVNDVVAHLLGRKDIEESLHQVDCHGFLPFHRAICNNYDDWDLLQTLIDRTGPAGLVSRTNKNDTAIHLASRRGRVRVLNKLCPLMPEGVIDSLNTAGCPAIYECVENWNVVLCLLNHGASRFTDEHGNTLLHAALAPAIVNIHRGVETRRALLERGQDLGAQNDDKDTPFHLAARNLNSGPDSTGMGLAALQELLGFRGEEPPHEDNKSSLVGVLQKRNNVGDTVHHLIASKEIARDKHWRAKEAVENILSICPDVLVSRDGEGNTPLHRASLVDNWFLVEALLQAQYGLETDARPIVNLQNEAGNIPLHLACLKGHLETVKKLMATYQSRRTILIRNKRKETPLHVAAGQGGTEILKELLQGRESYEDIVLADHECKLRDGRGLTPLHIAADNGIEDKATSLVDQMLSRCTGLDLLNEVEPSEEWTALHFAARRGHEQTVELLLLKGADSTKADRHNLTAADIANRQNHVEIADFIRQYRSRSFRLELGRDMEKPDSDVDDHFLALSWPKWDKAVRQQRGGPPRMWPQVTPVHQLVFKSNDTHYEAWATDRSKGYRRRMDPAERRYHQRRGAPGFSNMLEAIALAPIHQSQIRLSSCVNQGWIMKERGEFERTHDLEKVEGLQRQYEKRPNQAYLYRSIVFQKRKRLTRWIHFPANNVGIKMMESCQIDASVY